MTTHGHSHLSFPRPHPAACPPRALIIGAPQLGAVLAALEPAQLQLELHESSERAIASRHAAPPALAVVVIRPGESGRFSGEPSRFFAMQTVHRQWPRLPVLVVTDRPTVPEAVLAMQAGAAWYGAATPPGDLLRAVRVVLEHAAAPSAAAEFAVPGAGVGTGGFGVRSGIVGRSEALRKALRQSALVASTRTTVLLLGETGTGKERLAQAIHEASPRRRGPFVAVNCAALAETLLESELFGHEKGAFSGAHSRREGRFEMADGGTIFLDEIGEISLATQVKLLRVLQDRRFERAGGNQTLSVDVRVIAATNRNLRAMVEERTFRADLFYRLNVMAVEVPPLRERREDIPLIVEHLVPRLVVDLGLPESIITGEAMETLIAYSWPGNVRELENVLQRALVMAEGRPITAFELPEAPRGQAAAPPAPPGAPLPGENAPASAAGPAPLVPGASFREIERHVIMATYEACGRSPLRTAEMLGISPRTVHYRLREYRGEKGRRLPTRQRSASEEDQSAWPLHVVQSVARGAGGPDSNN